MHTACICPIKTHRGRLSEKNQESIVLAHFNSTLPVTSNVSKGESGAVAIRSRECGGWEVRGRGGQFHRDPRAQRSHLLQHSLGLPAAGRSGERREGERERERGREGVIMKKISHLFVSSRFAESRPVRAAGPAHGARFLPERMPSSAETKVSTPCNPQQ